MFLVDNTSDVAPIETRYTLDDYIPQTQEEKTDLLNSYGFDNNTFKPAQFDFAVGLWVNNNNHTFINNDDYSNLKWNSNVTKANDILGDVVSVPATNANGINILSFANEYAKSLGLSIKVNSMARPQAIQEFLKAQPRYYGVAAEKSTHRLGAIDFDVLRNSDGSINKEDTNTFIAQLKRKFGENKVVWHAGHIHVSP